MKFLVIPTTDWIGHPVPNRLNFIFDRLADAHEIDVCHFRIFSKKLMDTKCNLLPMDPTSMHSVDRYYLSSMYRHLSKIRDIAPEYDTVIASNLIPTFGASLQETPFIIDYLDLFPESAAAYFSPPVDSLIKGVTSIIDNVNLQRSLGIITTSERFKVHLTERYRKPIYVVPNGVDTSLIRPTDGIKEDLGYPVIGYVGSLEKWIDLEWIIDNLPKILKRYPDASLLVVGPGLHTSYGEKIKKMAARYPDRIHFTGRVDYHKISSYISSMDVGLNPRKPMLMNKLTMGSKVLNYLACGVPVLSTNMPEMDRRFGPEKGVFSYGSIDEFLGNMTRALKFKVDPSWVKDYDWDSIAVRYEGAIKSILDSG
ncbi:MAG: glycosyltransferase [Thermoplasmata archaeon]